jgi:ElaB/YqjD/DUF883 family membrane-anchored ribosome-binding protein
VGSAIAPVQDGARRVHEPIGRRERTVHPEDSAEALRQRMAELRRELTCDVRDVSRSAQEMADTAKEMANPLYYIRRFPWLSAAAAVAVGYLLVPKKRQAVNPDPDVVDE